MDEEELEKPSSKINLGSFFERIDSVEKVADNALTKSNVNFSVINNQKLLINSINVSIEAMETKIRDIANYIIIEKKVEKDAEQDRLLEQEDKEQKKSMLDRALAVGQQGPKGDPGKPAEQQQGGGGSFLGGLLKGLATLGISAFAIKYIGPVLLPKLLLHAKTKLIPIIGTALKGGFVKLAALIGKVITGLVAKIPFVGKALAGSALFTGVGAAIIGIGNFISNALSGKGGGGGGAVTGSNVGMTDSTVETGMTDTMQEKDLVPAVPAESFSEYQNRTRNKRRSGSKKEEKKFKVTTGKKNMTIEELEREIASGETKIQKMKDEGRNERKIEFEQKQVDIKKQVLKEKKLGLEVDAKTKYRIVEPIKSGTEEFDLSSNNVDGDMTQAIAKTNERIDNLIGGENKEQNNGNLVSANKPNVTEATLKLASAPLPFVKVIKNNQLSTSPKSYNGLPPEIAAMIS